MANYEGSHRSIRTSDYNKEDYKIIFTGNHRGFKSKRIPKTATRNPIETSHIKTAVKEAPTTYDIAVPQALVTSQEGKKTSLEKNINDYKSAIMAEIYSALNNGTEGTASDVAVKKLEEYMKGLVKELEAQKEICENNEMNFINDINRLLHDYNETSGAGKKLVIERDEKGRIKGNIMYEINKLLYDTKEEETETKIKEKAGEAITKIDEFKRVLTYAEKNSSKVSDIEDITTQISSCLNTVLEEKRSDEKTREREIEEAIEGALNEIFGELKKDSSFEESLRKCDITIDDSTTAISFLKGDNKSVAIVEIKQNIYRQLVARIIGEYYSIGKKVADAVRDGNSDFSPLINALNQAVKLKKTQQSSVNLAKEKVEDLETILGDLLKAMKEKGESAKKSKATAAYNQLINDINAILKSPKFKKYKERVGIDKGKEEVNDEEIQEVLKQIRQVASILEDDNVYAKAGITFKNANAALQDFFNQTTPIKTSLTIETPYMAEFVNALLQDRLQQKIFMKVYGEEIRSGLIYAATQGRKADLDSIFPKIIEATAQVDVDYRAIQKEIAEGLKRDFLTYSEKAEKGSKKVKLSRAAANLDQKVAVYLSTGLQQVDEEVSKSLSELVASIKNYEATSSTQLQSKQKLLDEIKKKFETHTSAAYKLETSVKTKEKRGDSFSAGSMGGNTEEQVTNLIKNIGFLENVNEEAFTAFFVNAANGFFLANERRRVNSFVGRMFEVFAVAALPLCFDSYQGTIMAKRYMGNISGSNIYFYYNNSFYFPFSYVIQEAINTIQAGLGEKEKSIEIALNGFTKGNRGKGDVETDEIDSNATVTKSAINNAIQNHRLEDTEIRKLSEKSFKETMYRLFTGRANSFLRAVEDMQTYANNLVSQSLSI